VSGYRRYRGLFLIATIVSTLCIAGLLRTGAAPAVADPGDDPRSAARAVDRAEAILENATETAQRAARQLAAATAALPAAQARVATARGVIVAARVESNTAQRRARTARTAYAAVASRFEQAQEQVVNARSVVDQIAAASYMGSDFARVNVLVGATDPQDMMDRIGLVDQVMQKQNSDVAALTAARWTARAEQDNTGLARRTADDTARAAAGKLAAARAAEAAAEHARLAVIQLTASRTRALGVARSQRAAVLARYRQAKAEEARIQGTLRAYAAKGGTAGGPYLGGGLLMPVNGWKSSDFGERYDPFYRVWQLHAGTDFAASEGSPIRAAAGGRVIRAGWYGGYGNYTCVGHGELHGEDFSTCYGHQSRILVHVGERVDRGEVIGLVGTTGASTGDHLHFETRFDGVPKNPLRYLPGCLC
jgi:murein DD-endopeptidase MepM/ murein hydrolase activator NlpD